MPNLIVTVEQQLKVKYLLARCHVRDWEDATIMGVEDVDGKLVPCRSGDCWTPLIDLDTAKIEAWPKGTIASVHYKVCDAGIYTLLDASKNIIARIDGYVPSMMSPGGDGYGDYVIMEIGQDGLIANFKIDLSAFDGAAANG